jgi:hypothetical protein
LLLNNTIGVTTTPLRGKGLRMQSEQYTSAHRPHKATTAALVEHDPNGWTVGRDPRGVPQADLTAAGHLPQPLLKIIRSKCLDCCTGDRAEVARCTAVACPLWPYRTGASPFAKPRGAGKKFSAKLARFSTANGPPEATEPSELPTLRLGRVGSAVTDPLHDSPMTEGGRKNAPQEICRDAVPRIEPADTAAGVTP